MTKKKFILKPGRHQFAPGSHAVHQNNNLSDEEAAWYLEKYPHIIHLFTLQPLKVEEIKESDKQTKKTMEMKNNKAKHHNQVKTLTPLLGGKGGL